ncbi:aromatic amino acid transaminase [Parvularcula lutaonensis]|uniref:Aromatic amino acid transaminase n=1 Tax=Parvularcula lutaonensis TaxID=491923 RepID=A0ABV7M6Z9_9PROT|nr:aromatic amino acid transaminase [Parvularcula lutaonensis]GGY56387.1 aromatic amino acid aminotransferase [Parvularcula lutaonensis]
MTTLLDKLEKAPADPLLGVMAAARADTRPDKIDLGVGIYKNSEGETPVMAAVKEAERILIEEETTKAYEGPHGNPLYCDQVGKMILGELTDRHTVFATPGGSGGLSIGMQLAKVASPGARLFVSQPNWPNHVGIGKAVGYDIHTFDWVSSSDGTPDMERVKAGLADARAGDVVLLQGPCHNPTGTDFSPAQWSEISSFLGGKGVLPFIDVAYQGFGVGLEEDIAPIRDFLAALPEAIVTYSCSKNFGLYRERTGALVLQAPSADALDAARGQAAGIIRTSYSMPPAHGPAVVATILSRPALREKWLAELDEMRGRLNFIRENFASALVRETNSDSFARIAHEKGMFATLPFKKGGVEAIREAHAIYMPGSGRVNIAGLSEDRIDEIARKMAPQLNPGS